MSATASLRPRPMATSWWQRLFRRSARPRVDADDAADLGTCFGLEAVLQAEEEARALAGARADAAPLGGAPEPRLAG